MTAMRVTHVVEESGQRVALIAPDLVKIDGVKGIISPASLAAVFCGTLVEIDSTDTIDVPDDDLQMRDLIVEGRERQARRKAQRRADH